MRAVAVGKVSWLGFWFVGAAAIEDWGSMGTDGGRWHGGGAASVVGNRRVGLEGAEPSVELLGRR
jgi:hypothetical protein